MKKILAVIIIAVVMCQSVTKGEEPENLYARAAILIDADSGRILYGKNENDVMPMASTTKIMTLLVALKYGNPSDRVTFSSYAAKEPDVQLNALKGEQYTLNELLYLMMLRSYNDVAMMVAEYVGGVLNGDTSPNNTTEESKEDVKRFIDEMNDYAVKLGLSDTYFVTPNGLDGEDEGRIHSTTAYELALIAREALKSEEVIKICTTKSFSYREQNGKRSGTITNGNRFLDINKNAIGMKTGFTGKAGYCFVGATKVDDRTFISVVLGCGWPPNKNYKWSDTGKLMSYGRDNYFYRNIFEKTYDYKEIKVENGLQESVGTYIPFEVNRLLSDEDEVDVIYEIISKAKAPVKKDEQVGKVRIYINGKLEEELPILTKGSVKEKTFRYFLHKIFLYYFM